MNGRVTIAWKRVFSFSQCLRGVRRVGPGRRMVAISSPESGRLLPR